jgi:hypothetical protein
MRPLLAQNNNPEVVCLVSDPEVSRACTRPGRGLVINRLVAQSG